MLIVSVRPAPDAVSVADGDPLTVTLTGAVNVPTHVPLTSTVPPAVNAAWHAADPPDESQSTVTTAEATPTEPNATAKDAAPATRNGSSRCFFIMPLTFDGCENSLDITRACRPRRL